MPCATIQYAHDQAVDGDTILIATGVYTENIVLSKDIILVGTDAEATIIDGQRQERVIRMSFNPPLDVAIRHLTLRNGIGGLLTSNGTTLVEGSVLYNNAAIADSGLNRDGGGIYSFGTLSVRDTTIVSNTGLYGGGIYARGSLTMSHSVVSMNEARSGGIGSGVSIGVVGPSQSYINNSTISQNRGRAAIRVAGAEDSLTLAYSTVVFNQAVTTTTDPGLLIGNDQTITLTNSIVANNTGHPTSASQCIGVNYVSLGHNISSDDSCNLVATNDFPNTNPLLGLLQDNGGPTWTHAIGPDSPAVDAGSNNDCPATDQRGRVRPFDGDDDSTAVCDIGPYEYGSDDTPPPPQTNRYVAPTGSDVGNNCLVEALPCATVQHAINQAFSSGETVYIAAGVYSETVTIAKNITLQGADAATTILDGGDQATRVIQMSYTPFYDVVVRNLTIRHGQGGILTSGGQFQLENSRVYGNDAAGAFFDEGGGLYLLGPTIISNTAVYSNSGQYGGGIYARAPLTLAHSAVYSNTASESGGGVSIAIPESDRRVVLSNSTLSGNSANAAGGFEVGSTNTAVSMTHVTIAYNGVPTASNTPGGVGVVSSVTVTMANTIVAHNVGGRQCSFEFDATSLGGNLSSDDSCGMTAGSDQLTSNVLLAPLRDNGGATWTHALWVGSTAVDAAESTYCLPVDQRGVSRPIGPACDSGAYEADGSEIPPMSNYQLFLPLLAR